MHDSKDALHHLVEASSWTEQSVQLHGLLSILAYRHLELANCITAADAEMCSRKEHLPCNNVSISHHVGLACRGMRGVQTYLIRASYGISNAPPLVKACKSSILHRTVLEGLAYHLLQVIARIGKLQTFNGSAISPNERKDAEVQFLRTIASQSHCLTLHTQDLTTDVWNSCIFDCTQ